MAQKMVPDRERLSFCSGIPGFNYSFSSASLIIEDKAASVCLWEFLQGTRDSPSMHPYFGRKTSITAGLETLPAVPRQSRSTHSQHTYQDGPGAAARHRAGTLGLWFGSELGQPGWAWGLGAAVASNVQGSHGTPGAATPASGTTSWQPAQRGQGGLDVMLCPKPQQDTDLRRHKGDPVRFERP